MYDVPGRLVDGKRAFHLRRKVLCRVVVTVGDAGVGQIKAITAATITSRAVTNGVNAGVDFYNQVLKGAQ